MKKLSLGILTALLLLTVSGIVVASMIIPAADEARERAKAAEKSPVINETESGNWELDRIDFIHYAKPANPGKAPKTETCYKIMGVKWNSLPVRYVINPSNPQSLPEGFVTSAVSTAAETWDASTSKELFNNAYLIDYSAKYGVQNYQNAVAFGDYPDANVIAITSVWYTRVGKQIVESDVLFNTRFNWGDAASNSAAMDLQNIATHELGHSVGLDDIYSTSCSSVTMYGYSTEGEIQKRTLEQADILGLQKIYGL